MPSPIVRPVEVEEGCPSDLPRGNAITCNQEGGRREQETNNPYLSFYRHSGLWREGAFHCQRASKLKVKGALSMKVSLLWCRARGKRIEKGFALGRDVKENY